MTAFDINTTAEEVLEVSEQSASPYPLISLGGSIAIGTYHRQEWYCRSCECTCQHKLTAFHFAVLISGGSTLGQISGLD
jgi:hypothetical protein